MANKSHAWAGGARGVGAGGGVPRSASRFLR